MRVYKNIVFASLPRFPKTFLNSLLISDGMASETVKAELTDDNVITESSDLARELIQKGVYGSEIEDGRIKLSLIEAMYLIEKGKITVLDGKGKEIKKDAFLRKARKLEKNFQVRYAVYKDIRDRGYIIKTALKFGADFRVYERGVKPGEDHAKWIIYPVRETDALTWYDFAAKNRVAHSTKKRLLIGIVDEENDVTYYEIRWVRP
jgi:tRNA-intron endonuclease